MGVGRKRLPDAIHVQRGTLKPHRHGKPDEKIALEAFVGEPPDMLPDAAKREWFRVVAAMRETGLFTRVDRALLTSYCALWAELAEALKTGLPWPPANYTALRLICSELGFTPASRAKLLVAPKPKNTGFDDL